MTALIAHGGATMALAVEVQRVLDDDTVPSSKQLTAWARATWQDADPVKAEIVVRVTDEDESRQLNHDFRGKDKSTNVLSFPYDPVPELDLHHIGDLVICAPVVEREAHEQSKTVEAHWAHMVVHGMLHLQGFDHENDEDAVRMEARETEILTGLGYPAPYLDDETK